MHVVHVRLLRPTRRRNGSSKPTSSIRYGPKGMLEEPRREARPPTRPASRSDADAAQARGASSPPAPRRAASRTGSVLLVVRPAGLQGFVSTIRIAQALPTRGGCRRLNRNVTRALLLLPLLAAFALLGGTTPGRTPAAAAAERSQVVVLLASPPLGAARETWARRSGSTRSIAASRPHFTGSSPQPGSTGATGSSRTASRSSCRPVTSRGLSRLPGVTQVFAPVTYHVQAGPDAATIRARDVPLPDLSNAGAGIKIGIIDDGVDQTHRFFDPSGYAMPAGFPKGQAAYTTAKVIVARAFPPPGATWPHAGKPFDPEQSSHGTHVAGIAAGNANTLAAGNGLRRRAAGVHRQLQGADDPDRRGRRPRRQRARDRRGDRGRCRRRDGRDQPVARGAGDRAVARHRRAGARRRGGGRRRPCGRGRERLRRLRPGVDDVAGELRAGDHRRRRAARAAPRPSRASPRPARRPSRSGSSRTSSRRASRSSRPTRAAGGRPPGRAWPRPTSRAPSHCCSSGIRSGRPRR